MDRAADGAVTGVQRVVFANAQVDWPVGGYRLSPAPGTSAFGSLLRTTDGGSTWTDIDRFPTPTASYAVTSDGLVVK